MTDDELLEWLGFQAEGANTDEDSRKFSAVIDRVLGRQIETRAVVRPALASIVEALGLMRSRVMAAGPMTDYDNEVVDRAEEAILSLSRRFDHG